MPAPEIKFKEGDLIFFEPANPYINGLKSKNVYEFGIIDHIYFDGYGVDIYEPFDTRKIEGIPVKDYDFNQKRRKLPKNWSYDTDLIHLTWDNQPDGYNGQVFNMDNKGYREGIEYGIFVPRSSQDKEGYLEVDINKEGYLITWKHQQYKISKSSYVLVPFNKAYEEPIEYAKTVEAYNNEVLRQRSLSDYDWIIETEIDKNLNRWCTINSINNETKTKIRTFLIEQMKYYWKDGKGNGIECRMYMGKLQWREEGQKKWIDIAVELLED